MEPLHRRIFLAGPAGQIEALLWAVPQTEAAARLPAIICHPHPLYGGTMHNKVAYQAAKTLHGYGLPVLRFNFRGAGLSEGVHDKGRGEQDDAKTALDFMAGEYPGAPLLLAGFSFGASIALRVGCADTRVIELIGLGLPVTRVDSENHAYLRSCEKPKILISGTSDVHGPQEKLEALVRQLPPHVLEQTRLQFVAEADHFFTGHLDELDRALSDWLTSRHPDLIAANTYQAPQ
jgi:hypothetical protein